MPPSQSHCTKLPPLTDRTLFVPRAGLARKKKGALCTRSRVLSLLLLRICTGVSCVKDKRGICDMRRGGPHPPPSPLPDFLFCREKVVLQGPLTAFKRLNHNTLSVGADMPMYSHAELTWPDKVDHNCSARDQEWGRGAHWQRWSS